MLILGFVTLIPLKQGLNNQKLLYHLLNIILGYIVYDKHKHSTEGDNAHYHLRNDMQKFDNDS